MLHCEMNLHPCRFGFQNPRFTSPHADQTSCSWDAPTSWQVLLRPLTVWCLLSGLTIWQQLASELFLWQNQTQETPNLFFPTLSSLQSWASCKCRKIPPTGVAFFFFLDMHFMNQIKITFKADSPITELKCQNSHLSPHVCPTGHYALQNIIFW